MTPVAARVIMGRWPCSAVSTGSPVAASAEQVAAFAGLRDRLGRLLYALDRTITIAPAVPTPVEP